MRAGKDTTRFLDPIPAREAVTLSGLLQCRIRRTPDKPAYHQYDRKQKKWVSHSWQAIGREVARWQLGLAREALAPGDRVALLLANSIQWICCEQAALALGMVVVPLYTWDSAENIAFLLHDSGSRLLLTGTGEQWNRLAPYAFSFSELSRILCLEDVPLAEVAGATSSSITNWLPTKGEAPPLPRLEPDDLATIVYTSGTTGPPKGVMLSHRNILWNAEAILKVVPSYTSDVLLSFLPLSHTFERTAGYYTPMMAGSSIAYARSMHELAEDLQTIRPTILISVPRIFEKVFVRVMAKVRQRGRIGRWLFQLTLDYGYRSFEAAQGRRPRLVLWQQLLHSLLHSLVATRILKRLGGRVRLAVSGGAPLQPTVSRFFLSLGLPLIQGYGLTEAAPVVSTNNLEHNIPASVGPPLSGVHCRLGPEQELLVKSPGLMAGYWNRPEQSREAIDGDGWLHTGDAVEVEDGVIFIRGRLKEIIVTSTGEKVPALDLEMTLAEDPLVRQVMVIGEGMPCLAALLVMEPSFWEKLARECGLDPDAPSSLESPAVKEVVLSRLNERLHAFPAHARIRAVALLLDDWSIGNGLLTPTLKLKRGAIQRCYAITLTRLYRDHEVVFSQAM